MLPALRACGKPPRGLTRLPLNTFQRWQHVRAAPGDPDIPDGVLRYMGPHHTAVIDRPLPRVKSRQNAKIVLGGAATMVGWLVIGYGFINESEVNSAEVQSIMYSLRHSDTACEVLGEAPRFRDSWPWISGKLSPLTGRINVSFPVKGSRQDAECRFHAIRRPEAADWEVVEFTLTTADGTVTDLTGQKHRIDRVLSEREK